MGGFLMDTVFAILGFIALIGLVVGIIAPKVVLPKSGLQTRGRAAKIYGGLFIIFFILFAVFGNSDNSNNAANSGSTTSATQTQNSKEKDDQAKAAAKADAMAILGSVPQKVDEVEKTTWYRPWGAGPYPAQDNIYWTAVVDGNKDARLYALFVNFTSHDYQWTFWDTVIFSTDKGKKELNLNAFAGQSGDGKNTEVVNGGKYETLFVSYDKVYEYIKFLTEGNNPIIRYEGRQYHYDYKVPAQTMERLKQSLKLYEDLKTLNNSLQ